MSSEWVSIHRHLFVNVVVKGDGNKALASSDMYDVCMCLRIILEALIRLKDCIICVCMYVCTLL